MTTTTSRWYLVDVICFILTLFVLVFGLLFLPEHKSVPVPIVTSSPVSLSSQEQPAAPLQEQEQQQDLTEPQLVIPDSRWDVGPGFPTMAVFDKFSVEDMREIKDAVEANIPPELHRWLGTVVCAIRLAENGGPGREFGILDSRASTFRKQAGWCAATVYKNFQRWENAGSPGSFLVFLRDRYCPLDAANDPTGLNSNWLSNVHHWWVALMKY